MVFLDRNTQTKILLHHEFQNQFNMQKFINVKQMILLMFHNSFFVFLRIRTMTNNIIQQYNEETFN